MNTIIKYFSETYKLNLSLGWQPKIISQLYANGHLEKGLRVIVRGPRGMRKSTTFDMLILDEALHRSHFVILSSVGAVQSREHVLHFRTLLKQAGLYGDLIDERSSQTGIEINLKNGSRILCIPQSDSVVGFHPSILYIDELARIDPNFFWTVIDRFSMGKPDIIKIITSTPYGTSTTSKNNPFHDIFTGAEKDIIENKKPKYIPINVTLEQCPWITPEEVAEAKQHMPDHLFRQEILGEFVEHLYGIFSSLQLEAMRCSRIEEIHLPLFGGLDLGHRKDYTALVVSDSKYNVIATHRWKGAWESQISNVAEMVRRYKISMLTVDATGVGDPIFEFMHKMFTKMKLSVRLIPFKFTTRTKPQLINKLMTLAETGQLKVPEVNAKLYEEIAHFKFLDATMRQTGAAKGYHDDLLIALGLAVFNIKENVSEVKVLSDIFQQNHEIKLG